MKGLVGSWLDHWLPTKACWFEVSSLTTHQKSQNFDLQYSPEVVSFQNTYKTQVFRGHIIITMNIMNTIILEPWYEVAVDYNLSSN